MSFSIRSFSVAICAVALWAQAAVASTVKGAVADSLGARIVGADVQLVAQGAAVAKGKTSAQGEFSLTAPDGRYALVVAAAGFDSQQTESFFAGGAEVTVATVTLTPSRVQQQVTVTATGVPTPRAQVSSAVTVLGEQELADHADVTMPLNLVPGVTLTQTGQRGGVASLFIWGGSSTSAKVLMNGVPADDVGGRFDYSTVSATDLDSIEVYRGPDSVLYGSDAASGVVSFSTQRGTSAVPILSYAADGGNFGTVHASSTLSGAADRLDYFAGLDVFNTGNSIPLDTFRDTTAAANFGYSLDSRNQLRATVRNSDSAAGVPDALDFYGIADPAKQADQDLYATGAYDSRTTDRWHTLVRYGVARKREQYTQFGTNGILDAYGDYDGLPVTIRGANGYSVTGAAILDYGGTTYPYTDLLVSNRDQLYAQSEYAITPHMTGLFSFRYENERGLSATPYGTTQAQRTNYDYTVQLGGDIKNRLFYSLGGGLQKNEIFGIDTEPRIGLAYYAVKPGSGAFQGTKLMANFAKGLQEPSISEQVSSLYATLLGLPCAPPSPCGPQLIQQYGITPVGALLVRNYNGGVEQLLFHQKATMRVRYFHNEFGNQVEYIPTQGLADLPGGGISQTDIMILENGGVYGAYTNTLSYRAQGVESEIEAQPAAHIFLRAGYTWLEARVQRSLSSDVLTQQFNPAFPAVQIGAYDPLVGARPFRIPPHKGFFSVTYQQPRWFVALTGSIVGRADDSTFLSDANFGNTLLLPNRDLDPSYQRIDLGGSYSVRSNLAMYAQVDNLLSQQRAGVLGYPALPLNFRSGIKYTLGGK
jgi:vitamin B12 transporter